MKRFDWTIWLGVGISLTAICAGAWFEGLNLGFLWHPTAALIVGGGTLGAVIVRRGTVGVISAMRAVWQLRLKGDDSDAHNVELAKLAWLSRSARKNGVKAYEDYAESCPDALISQGLTFLADHAESEQLRQVLTRRLDAEDELGLHDSATFEAAGGFAPTFGIIGAVLGLITVLRVLDKPDSLGIGIATAFVATIYGIGLANILFFPLAARLRERHEAQMKRREEIAVVILSLAAKETPRAIINKFNLRK
ncbi:MAG: MotA/TolQ/ExbB proton channel family protein [Pyrinomonadaceae bacterium]|nr:MotA/TolQ/ExbB proton channel family protein [Pyrinomonadaceae bacterium]